MQGKSKVARQDPKGQAFKGTTITSHKVIEHFSSIIQVSFVWNKNNVIFCLLTK